MIKFLQINLNRYKTAQQLLLQTALDTDVLVVSEQNSTHATWNADVRDDCAIGIISNTTLDEIGKPGCA